MIFREFKEKVIKMPFFRSDVAEIFSISAQAMRNQLVRWKKQELIVELKRGLYVLSKKERLIALSKELAAGSIYQPSYISLESALSYYKMIPERVTSVTSVTTKKTKRFHNSEGIFIYRSIKIPLYFGFLSKKDEYGFPYFLAEPEKALLDYLYLNLGKIKLKDKDFFSQSLRLQNYEILDRKKILAYAKRYQIKKLDQILKELI